MGNYIGLNYVYSFLSASHNDINIHDKKKCQICGTEVDENDLRQEQPKMDTVICKECLEINDYDLSFSSDQDYDGPEEYIIE